MIAAMLVALTLAHGGQISDDSPAFDCRYDGNRICGPGNAQGVLPGDYSNPNCWPGAIYCPPADAPADNTVTRG